MTKMPQQLKTDNESTYTSHKTQAFFHTWGIKHITDIAHSPTEQATVEKTHYTL